MQKSFKIYISILIHALSISAHSATESICSSKVIKDLVATSSPAFSNNLLTQKIRSSDVTVVGEIHLYTDLRPRLDLIKKFNEISSGKKCVAYEWANQTHDFVSFLKKISYQISALTKKSNTSAQEQDLLETYKAIYEYYWPMAKLTQKLKMKAIMVDHKDHNFKSDKTMDERNNAMAKVLSSLIKNHSCDSILYFVGKAHLSKANDSTTRVQDLLANKNLKVTTINLQLNDENYPDPLKSWSVCGNQKNTQIKKYTYLDNRLLEKNYALFPLNADDPAIWQDFDFTLLAP